MLALVRVSDAVAAHLLIYLLDPSANLLRLAVALGKTVSRHCAGYSAERGRGQAAVTIAYTATEQCAGDPADHAAAVHCGVLLGLATLNHIADLRLLDAIGEDRRDVDDRGKHISGAGVQGCSDECEEDDCECFFHGDTFQGLSKPTGCRHLSLQSKLREVDQPVGRSIHCVGVSSPKPAEASNRWPGTFQSITNGRFMCGSRPRM